MPPAWKAGGGSCRLEREMTPRARSISYVQLSYIATANVHILEQGIRAAFKKPGMRVLSDLLKGD